MRRYAVGEGWEVTCNFRNERRASKRGSSCSPAVIAVIALLIYPVLSSLYYSLTNKGLIRPTYRFVGLDNFTTILQNGEFWSAFGHSIQWTVGSIVGEVAIGFLAALALERIPRFAVVYRTLLIIPWAFPAIILAFTWTWILNDVYGFLPNLATRLGLSDSNVALLSNPSTVFWVVVGANVWFGIPLIMVNVLSALKTIPKDQVEAAVVDGAGAAQKFRFVTLPHVRNVVGLLVILRVIWIFNNFEILFLLTGGGPAGITTTVPIFAYRTGWGLRQLGMASAVTVLLLIFLFIVTAIAFRLIRGRREAEA